MLRLFSRSRPKAAPARRSTFLRLESLEWRDQPSGLGVDDPTDPTPGSGEYVLATPPANQAPEIVNFGCTEIANGLFIFSGRVIDEFPGGLTITFSGSVDSMDGKTTITNADGTFTYTIQLKFDGSDNGAVAATTVDAGGLVSNEPITYVTPTPPPGGP